MMGRVTEDLSEVVTKTTGGLFVLPKGHSHVMRMTRPLSTEIRIGKSACEVCRYCTDFCPRYLLGHKLEPHKIMRVINYDRDLDSDTITSAWLCCECGLCDLWSCPMSLSPRVIYREFKRRLKDAGIINPHRRTGLTQDFYRPFRGVPMDRLIRRLGLGEYDIKPPFDPAPWPVSSVRIPLDQHIGAMAVPVVKQGEKVAEGQAIGEIPEGKLGARYHASIDGVVTAINEGYIAISGRGK
jgi:Na+-translocating ferredoxin:NAD+ oxidoreductase RnfC subunit